MPVKQHTPSSSDSPRWRLCCRHRRPIRLRLHRRNEQRVKQGTTLATPAVSTRRDKSRHWASRGPAKGLKQPGSRHDRSTILRSTWYRTVEARPPAPAAPALPCLCCTVVVCLSVLLCTSTGQLRYQRHVSQPSLSSMHCKGARAYGVQREQLVRWPRLDHRASEDKGIRAWRKGFRLDSFHLSRRASESYVP